MKPSDYKNRILQRLDEDALQRLRLKPLTLSSGREIENPGEPIRHLIFLEDGIGSMTTTFRNGFQVEVGMFGVESVMGASALVGTRRSLNKVYMQMAGHGFSCTIASAIDEFRRFDKFHDLVLRYLQAELVQTCQSAGCNAHHEIPQRLSRWLMLCDDRSEAPTLHLTQEYLADMLGTARASVSLAAEALQREGLIQYSRGKVVILDRPGLEKRACECYRVVKDHLDNYLEVDQA